MDPEQPDRAAMLRAARTRAGAGCTLCAHTTACAELDALIDALHGEGMAATYYATDLRRVLLDSVPGIEVSVNAFRRHLKVCRAGWRAREQ